MNSEWLSYFTDAAVAASVDELDQIEQRCGITLPSSLRRLYGTVGDGVFRLGLYVGSDATRYDVHQLISARPTKRDCGFVADYEDLVKTRRLLPEQLVPFAVEGGGNYYLVDRADESIWYADMELTTEGVLPQPVRISDSLELFLRELRPRDDCDV